MNLSVNNKFLDLAEQFTVEATVSNPLFSATGALTAPVQLPASRHNAELLNHPERIDRSLDYSNTFDAKIHSADITQCRLEISSAHEIDGFDATVYFNDGDFYNRARALKLNQLQTIRDDWGGDVTALLDHLMAVMREEIDDDFMLFPVCIQLDEGDPDADPPTPNTGIILNATADTGDTTERFIAYSPIVETIDGVNITLPVGYAVTPFLKFHVILRMAITHFGYTLVNNPWEDDPQLRRMVFLNNTADACLVATSASHVGMLSYSQLLPSITVTELLDICQAHGYIAQVNSATMTVRFVPVPDIINSAPDTELTSALASRIITYYNNSKQLSLTAAGTVSPAEPTFDSYSEMWKSYKPYGNFINWNETQFADINTAPNYYNIIRSAIGDYYSVKTGINSSYRKKLSTPYFNHTPTSNTSEQSFASPEHFVSVDFPDIPNKTADRLMPMFLINAVHYNTAVDRDGSLIEENKQTELAATLCYAYGRAKKADGTNEKYFFGSTRCFDNIGNAIPGAWSSIDFVSPTGYYELYFKDLEKFLKTGIYIEAEFDIDSADIEQMNLMIAKLIKNQPYLIEKITYLMGENQNRANITAWLNKPSDQP